MVSTNHFAPLWSDDVFSQAISIGNFCHSAQILKELGYRVFSGPFDWIFTNPRASGHILRDDFAFFLDRSHYLPVAENDRKVPEANLCEHLYYKHEYGVNYMFNHHLPNEEADYAHYLQSVSEFRAALASPKPVLLLMVTHGGLPIDQYHSLLEALDQYGDSYRLVAIQFRVNNQGVLPPLEERVSAIHHDSKFLLVDLHVHNYSQGNAFLDATDNHLLSNFMRTFKVGSIPQFGS